MELKALTDLSPDDIASAIDKRRVVLFSPRMRNRNALLAAFTNDTNALVYMLDFDNTTLPVFLQGLVDGLRTFQADFGTQTIAALGKGGTGVAEFAEALAADLGKVKPKVSALILDGLDVLVPTQDVISFFEHLVGALPREMQLVINSRILSYAPWNTMVEAGTAVVLGDETTLDGGIYNPAATREAHIEVYGFGNGKVFVNGLPVETWDGPLPRHLFYYFIDHPLVTRDEIFETFWPGLNTKEATNVFHVTKRKISERLGYELTTYSGGFYRPSGQMTIHYDAASFEESCRQGEIRSDRSAIEQWYSAIKLYRTEYLHKFDMPWIRERREYLKLKYVEALVGVARLYKSLGELDKAIHFYLRALREVPQREDIHRDLMTIYAGQHEREKALAQYAALEDILQKTLHIKPSKATRLLYDLLVEGKSAG
jgi:DNA-binding SARP family transcriptional activator